MRQKQIPISLLTGYLGAGKTSLLNHVLQNQKGYRVAVVVNDIGEINVDASLIADKGFVREADENLIPLQNGCICCTLKQDLIKQMLKLALSGRFDAILIEASGICEPIPIAQSLTPSPNASAAQEDLLELCYLDSITAVVDAKRMADEFDNGDALTRPGIDEDDIENLLVQQIEFCNTVVLNKVDLVAPEQKQRIRAMILALQPGAHIIEANYGAVDCKEILFTHAFSFAKAITSTGWADAIAHAGEPETDEYGIGTFVYRQKRGFDSKKFDDYVQRRFPASVIRCKGSLWFADEPDTAYIFEQAGKQISAVPYGRWLAAAPKGQQTAALRANPTLRKAWDATYGDRCTKLAFIGQNMDREQITAALDACLAPKW